MTKEDTQYHEFVAVLPKGGVAAGTGKWCRGACMSSEVPSAGWSCKLVVAVQLCLACVLSMLAVTAAVHCKVSCRWQIPL